MKKVVAFFTLIMLCFVSLQLPACAANENWRSPFVTRIMKTISQDPSYTDVVLTDLDRNGIPEAFVIKKGAYGGIGAAFTMSDNAIVDIQTPSNIIGECLENINVYLKNDTYIFVGIEVPRYTSQIFYYKLELVSGKLIATRIKKSDVSPYSTLTYVDKYSSNLIENGYPNRNKILDFVYGYDVVNSISATPSSAKLLVDGEAVTIEGYSVNDSNYFKIRDIAMLLKSTDKRFNVRWDSTKNAIMIDTNNDYIPIGGELSGVVDTEMEVVENDTPIYVDGKQRAITAYNINGSAYFKIRDIANAAGFEILWDGESRTININTH